MRSMWMIGRLDYRMFNDRKEPLIQARKMYAELKGGRIKNVIHANPSFVTFGQLYRDGKSVVGILRKIRGLR